MAELAREAGALTVGIVTKPFLFEGRKRMRQAEQGIAEMRKHVDTMIVVPNERLLAVVGKGIPFQDALKKADEVLLHATQGISTLITKPGLVNVDFADVRTVMREGGSALMGTGIGRGENRAMEAAQQAISSPLLDNVSISGSRGVLLNITGGGDLTLGEVTQISDIVHDAAGDDAEIIFGAVHEPGHAGRAARDGYRHGVRQDRVHGAHARARPSGARPRRAGYSVPGRTCRPHGRRPAAVRRFPGRGSAAPGPAGRRRQGQGGGRSERHGDPDLHSEADGLKVHTARAITYSVVAVLAVLAIRSTPPLAQRPAAAVLADSGPIPSWKLTFDSVARGETLVNVLERGGLSDTAAGHVVLAATSLDPRRIPTGLPVAVLNASPADSQPVEVVVQLAVDHFLHLVRGPTGWTERDERLPWKTDTVAVLGTIHSNLYQAMYDAADSTLSRDAQTALVVKLADDVYEYRVDMSRDLQDGDTFRVLAERSRLSNGTTRIGDIVAAQLDLSGTEIDAVHYTSDRLAGDYFDQRGRSLKAAFLRAPLLFKYISSGFGNRYHPILKLWRDHKGIDYAANAGTPVRAIGNGVVARAGWASGYGNLIEIRHPNGFIVALRPPARLRPGHPRRRARGHRRDDRLRGDDRPRHRTRTCTSNSSWCGVQRDPRVALRNVGGEPIPAALMASFDSVRDRLMGELLAGTGGAAATVAQR